MSVVLRTTGLRRICPVRVLHLPQESFRYVIWPSSFLISLQYCSFRHYPDTWAHEQCVNVADSPFRMHCRQAIVGE